jgi:hypothetical protein
MILPQNYKSEYTKEVIWSWTRKDEKLKGKYKNEHAGKVKIYKLSKEEMEEYLKKFK